MVALANFFRCLFKQDAIATSDSSSAIGPCSISGRVKQCASQKPMTPRLRDIRAPASIGLGVAQADRASGSVAATTVIVQRFDAS